MQGILKASFPMSDLSTPKLFFKIKCSDAEQLDLAFEEFISNLVCFISETFLGKEDEDLNKQLRETIVKVGHYNDYCVVMFDLYQEGELLKSFVEMVEEDIIDRADTLAKELSVNVGIKNDLKDVLQYVGDD